MSGGFLGFTASAIFNGLGGWPKIVQSMAISALSAIGAFVVTFLVSLVRAPAILHTQQQVKIEEIARDNKRLSSALSEQAAQKPRFPPKLEATLRAFISEHPQSMAQLDYLMKNEEWDQKELMRAQGGQALIASGILKSRLIRSYYGGADYACSIVDLYRRN